MPIKTEDKERRKKELAKAIVNSNGRSKTLLRCEFKIIQKLTITFLQINALTDILCVVKEFIAKTQSRSGPLGSICFWFRCTQPNSNQSLRCTTARKLSSCISNFAFVAIDTN